MFILCAALNTAEIDQSQHTVIKEENINEFWATRENSFMAGFFRWALASYESLGNRRILDFPGWAEKDEDIFQSSVLWLSNTKKRRINSKCQHLSGGTGVQEDLFLRFHMNEIYFISAVLCGNI